GLLLATLAAAQERPHFEVDMIFPRNESYTLTHAFPIAYAIQNITPPRTLGEIFIHWEIIGLEYSWDTRGGGSIMDSGILKEESRTQLSENYTVFVDYTDVYDWIKHKEKDMLFSLQWDLWRESDREEECRVSYGSGELQFSIMRDGEQERLGLGVEPDVAKAGECPVFGTVVEIWPNVTDSRCPDITITNEGSPGGIEGKPCEVVVDDELAGSIKTEVARLYAEDNPPPVEYPGLDEEDAAGYVRPPVGTACAAVCALGYIAFASW
ncbi:hypothetical protein IMZ48_03035, partial [Candidatus Bathyarchaeota archaeon]|nr:hypothetical protein [Candidatus Bathyarchaeota archaeon]